MDVLLSAMGVLPTVCSCGSKSMRNDPTVQEN